MRNSHPLLALAVVARHLLTIRAGDDWGDDFSLTFTTSRTLSKSVPAPRPATFVLDRIESWATAH
jgi:hypothetical protein